MRYNKKEVIAMTLSATRAKNRYNEKHYDRLSISVRKGEKEKIKKISERRGESLNRFVLQAIYEKINKK